MYIFLGKPSYVYIPVWKSEALESPKFKVVPSASFVPTCIVLKHDNDLSKLDQNRK